MKINKYQEIVELVNQDLKQLGHNEDQILIINQFMTIILVTLQDVLRLDRNIIFHKNTAQVFRSMANLIDLIVEKKNDSIKK